MPDPARTPFSDPIIVMMYTNGALEKIQGRSWVWWGSFSVGDVPGNVKYYTGGGLPNYGEVIQAVVLDRSVNIYYVFIQLLLGSSHVYNWTREELAPGVLFDQATGKFWGQNDQTYQNFFPTVSYRDLSPQMDTATKIVMYPATTYVQGHAEEVPATPYYIGTSHEIPLRSWSDTGAYTKLREYPQYAYYPSTTEPSKSFMIFVKLQGLKVDGVWEDILAWSLPGGQNQSFYHDSGNIWEQGWVPLIYSKWQQL